MQNFSQCNYKFIIHNEQQFQKKREQRYYESKNWNTYTNKTNIWNIVVTKLATSLKFVKKKFFWPNRRINIESRLKFFFQTTFYINSSIGSRNTKFFPPNWFSSSCSYIFSQTISRSQKFVE
jgi:hypothetical protein